MKKVPFCKLKMSLNRFFLQFTNILGNFFKCIFRFCCKFSMKIIFYLYQQTQEPRHDTRQSQSLSWYLFLQLLHLSLKFRVPKCLEERRHLGYGHKTVNSQQPRIFRVTGANQNARKVLFTDLVNTKIKNYLLNY